MSSREGHLARDKTVGKEWRDEPLAGQNFVPKNLSLRFSRGLPPLRGCLPPSPGGCPGGEGGPRPPPPPSQGGRRRGVPGPRGSQGRGGAPRGSQRRGRSHPLPLPHTLRVSKAKIPAGYFFARKSPSVCVVLCVYSASVCTCCTIVLSVVYVRASLRSVCTCVLGTGGPPHQSPPKG